jgi:hypothetical protein
MTARTDYSTDVHRAALRIGLIAPRHFIHYGKKKGQSAQSFLERGLCLRLTRDLRDISRDQCTPPQQRLKTVQFLVI